MLIATAGHVDHGKTSLVRALTGVDTDRLLEEKQRGLTIELGFAYKTVSLNQTLGFIDVPGHHRFMNTMISGVTGIDLGMLIVAADDGPMPQTSEHLQILKVLGVTNFLCVITKIDLVDEARLDAVTQQIGALLPGAQVGKVSTKTNAGITKLANTLLGIARKKPHNTRRDKGHFRLFVDRVFTKKGSGLVVTGTALSGKINIGDTLYLHSTLGAIDKKTPVKVRTLHVQGRPEETGYAGQRCAINLTGKLSTQDVGRGDMVCAEESMSPSLRLDCQFKLTHSEARVLNHMGRVKLYIGSRKISARTYFLSQGDTLGQWLQLILDKSVIACHGDHFLVKDDSERHILGGGIVIDPIPKKPGKNRTAHLNRLKALALDSPGAAFGHLVFEAGTIVNVNTLKRIWNLTDVELENILRTHPFKCGNFVKLPRKTGDLILSATLWNDCEKCLLQTLLEWHRADPNNRSMAIDMLQRLTCDDIGEKVSGAIFSDILSGLIGSGKITRTENQVRLFGFKPKLTLRSEGDWQRLENLMRGRLPLRSEIEKELGFGPLKIEALTRPKLKSGDLFNIGEKRIGHPETLYAMAVKVFELSTHGPFTIIDAKHVFGLGRGQTIEVLEFFDTINLTVRNANTRTATNLDVARRVFKQ